PLYFFFWRNLIHKKCPLSDKRFYFFNCLPKREHTIGSLLGRLSLNELNSTISFWGAAGKEEK
uniref:hypothetical protein n=1 Tax=Anaerobutyricum hallii TaxID=39488 RepID=UPI003FEE5966